MNETNHYDVLIIGGGQAGIPLAHALHRAGRQVALAERGHLGGSCVNYGCTPTKSVISSAKLAHQARRAGEYGLEIEVKVDFPAVIARAKEILLDSRTGLQDGFEGEDTPTLLRGHARFTGRSGEVFNLTVDDQAVTADRVILNTGTRSVLPGVEGLDDVEFIHAENWLEQTTLPEHLLILGGGYIGLELGQFYHRMGAQVTVVEAADQLLSHEDKDVAEKVQELLSEEGITFHLNAKATKVTKQDSGVVLTVEKEGDEVTLSGSHLFVAVGRQPNTDELGLDTVGVELDDKGIVQTDERLATSVKGVWVAGDIRGGPMFTHTAYDDYRVLESQLLEDGTHTTQRVIPYGVFTDPQLGRVGMTEKQARDEHKNVKTATYEMKKNGRARAEGKTEGFIKVVVNEDTRKMLGAAVLAAEGAEMVHAYITLMNADATVETVQNDVHIHPTYSEGIQSVLEGLDG